MVNVVNEESHNDLGANREEVQSEKLVGPKNQQEIEVFGD